MFSKISVLIVGSLSLLFVSGCYYDKADQVYPSTGTCDTSVVRLSVEINNILAANCYRCHGGTAEQGGGITLDNYDVLKAYADNGLLVSSVAHDGSTTPMPKDAAKLSDCDIAKITKWVNDGAPNN